MRVLELQVNGTRRRVEVDGERSLLSVLRDELDLTGAKYGCGEGQCGACTVLVDGRAVRSCLTQAASVEGKQVTTVEGLERNGNLHPLQEAFLAVDAMQCGYRTAGMIMSGVGLLTEEIELEPERYELTEGPAYHFELGEMQRRDFFRALGGGVLIVLALKDSPAQQESGRGGRRSGPPRPVEVGAWLRIAEDGTVTAYTGKVEVGQNIRTSLTQAVAEELRAPVSAINLVMGDTDLTPIDPGTFGSLTTPDMFPQLRKAAAAAREIMLDLAAEQLKLERGSLLAANGKVTHPE